MDKNIELSKLVSLAKQLAQMNDFSNGAVLANERILALDPNDVDARNRIARCYINSGRIDDAERMYQSVLQLDQADSMAQSIARRGIQEIAQVRCGNSGVRADGIGESLQQSEATRSVGLSPALVRALKGKAITPSEMVEALLHIEAQLRPKDRWWIRAMDETAAGFSVHDGFTPAQEEVIAKIYRQYL
jgi:tetratricopeptide (TPR) repeat protein